MIMKMIQKHPSLFQWVPPTQLSPILLDTVKTSMNITTRVCHCAFFCYLSEFESALSCDWDVQFWTLIGWSSYSLVLRQSDVSACSHSVLKQVQISQGFSNVRNTISNRVDYLGIGGSPFEDHAIQVWLWNWNIGTMRHQRILLRKGGQNRLRRVVKKTEPELKSAVLMAHCHKTENRLYHHTVMPAA